MKTKSSLNLLLKNSFKNTLVAWPVVLGLTLLIALLSLVISLMTSIGTRVVDNYKDLEKASNVRDAVLNMNINELVPDNKQYGQNNVENQQKYIYDLDRELESSKDKNLNKLAFYWSRTEGRNFPGIQITRKKNKVDSLKIKIVSKVTPNVSDYSVDSLAISEGRDIVYNHDDSSLPDNPHDVVLDATFAKRNKIKIGDIIRVQEDDYGSELLVKSKNNNTAKFLKDEAAIDGIQDLSNPTDNFNTQFSTYNWLQVCGFGESADFTMPIIDDQTPMPNKNTELIAYVNPHVMGLYKDASNANSVTGFVSLDITKSTLQVQSANDEEAYYSLKFMNKNFKPTKADIKTLNQKFLDILQKAGANKSSKQYIFLNGDPDYEFASRTSGLKKTIKAYESIAGIILAVVAVIVIFSVALISKKQIDKTRSQIGVLKALGYKKRTIVWNYVTMPFISALVGGIIGFIISQAIQGTMIALFTKYFNLDIAGWSFDIPGFFVDVVVMWFVITAIGFGIAYWVMNVDTLELLSAAKASHISPLGMKIKSMNKTPYIKGQMTSALLASNSGKMTAVTLVVLVATIIMTAAFSLPTVLKQNKSKSYTGVKYKQVVQYNDPVYNNPYTFMQTWDPTKKDQNYEYSTTMNRLTASPLIKNTNGTYGDYDYREIMRQLETGNISSEYYDLEFGATPDGDPTGKETDTSGLPNALQGMTANMKMLQMYQVVLSNKYFKAISDWAIKDSFGWNILANQWPDYLSFVSRLQSIGAGDNLNDRNAWVDSYYQLQNFYKKYIESVGLTITRDYYDYTSKDAKTVKTNDGKDVTVTPSVVYKKADKTNDDYAKQIDLFNANESGRNDAFESYIDETDSKNAKAFGKLLTDANNGLTRSSNFYISDGTNGLPINHIYNTDVIKKEGNSLDHYLTDKPEDMTIGEIKQRVADYLTWYGAFFSQRSGTAIVQAGFSRPPYFVQQYAKKAYYANNDTDIYRFGFSTAPFNPELDQLGTEISAEVPSSKKGKAGTDFKIYGIQNNNKFLTLKDSKGHDLIKELFSTRNSLNQYDTPSIVVNKSLATKLNLKKGQTVSWKVLYKELQNTKQGYAYDTDDWKEPNPRLNADAEGDTGWISANDMDTFNISLQHGDDEPIAFTAGNTNLTNAPSEFYQKYLSGEIQNKNLSKDQEFNIIGVSTGYGTPAAWIKNDDANNVLQYNQAKEYFWNNLFRKQVGDIFAEVDSNKAKDQMRSAQLLLSSKAPAKPGYIAGTKALYTTSDKDNEGKLMLVDYKTFQSYIDGSWDKKLLSSTDREIAERINTIFNNAWPIYNYKYSLSDDIGDLQAAVSTWDETGGYSPIEENGGIVTDADGKTTNINAIGQGALASLQPVEISKQILNQLSSVIMAVVIIIIALIIILTFIIIMLTTSLIISDNVRFISTMKVLGYSTTQIVNTVLGMYAIAIVCAYVVGFIVGWFMLSGIVHGMALTTTFVLPLVFQWWLLFAVMLAVIGIYIITFAVGFIRIKKANPLDALKNMEI